MTGISYFTIFDYIVVGASLLLPLVIGIYHVLSSTKQSAESLFIGERSLNVVPVAISIMITYMSASTIIDYPTEMYHFGIEIIAILLVIVVFVPLGACVFVPMLYDKNVTSIYEYLGNRFNSDAVKWMASLTFIIQQLVLTAITMFLSAVVVEQFIGLPIWVSVVIVGTCATLYTTLGGLKTIVWVETFQLVVIICSLVAIVSKGILKAGGFYEIIQTARNHEVMPYFKFTFSPFIRHNFFSFLLWHGFYAFVLPGCDQLQFQRYSSLPKRRKALNAVLLTVPIKVLMLILCLLAGIVIYAAHTSGDSMHVEKVLWRDGRIVSEFVREELRYIPGMMGLFTASLLALTLSYTASPINSLSAVTWNELFNPTDVVSHMHESKQATISRSIEIFYGCILIGLAIATEYLQDIVSIWTVTFGTLSVTYSVLAGVFIMAMFFPCSNKFGAVIGFLSGMAAIVFLLVNTFLMNRQNTFPDISFSNETSSIVNIIDHPALIIKNKYDVLSSEWLEKLSLISYLLYPVIGSVITLVVGLLISILTGGLCQCCKKEVESEHLHPFLRCKCDCCANDVEFESLAVSQRYADRISVHNIYTGIGSSTTKLHTTPPSYTYYQYSPVVTRISRNLDTVYSEVSTASNSPYSRQSAEYENI